MVRLEDAKFTSATLYQQSFNSYMVRLEERDGVWMNTFQDVSIPIWCDWKEVLLCVSLMRLTVSIPIWCDWKLLFKHGMSGETSFNSYMVRLEEPAKGNTAN